MTRRLSLAAFILALMTAPLPARTQNDIPAKSDADSDATVIVSSRPGTCENGNCGNGSCGCSNDSCGCDWCCADDSCHPYWRVFGEYLLLRPGNERVSYAVPINGPNTPPGTVVPIPVGTEASVDNGFNSGFRVGAGRTLNDCANLSAAYAYFDSTSADSIGGTPTFPLRSLVNHPSTANATTNFLAAAATLEVKFQLADVDYRRILVRNDCYALNYVVGIRYGNLVQEFASAFAGSDTREFVNSDITFDGGGVRLGLEGKRRAGCSGWLLYGKGYASFLGGVERVRYSQFDPFRQIVVNTGWNQDRIVSILDLELGLGWSSCSGNFRVTAGYVASAWLNTINSGDFIRAVRTNTSNQSEDLRNTLTFDGLVARAEVRF